MVARIRQQTHNIYFEGKCPFQVWLPNAKSSLDAEGPRHYKNNFLECPLTMSYKKNNKWIKIKNTIKLKFSSKILNIFPFSLSEWWQRISNWKSLVGLLCQNSHFKNGKNKWKSLPGFDNSLEPAAGTDGVRITIQQEDAVPNPSLEGFDIPPGFSSTIGVMSSEVKRLPMPYGNCTNINIETGIIKYTIFKKHLGLIKVNQS